MGWENLRQNLETSLEHPSLPALFMHQDKGQGRGPPSACAARQELCRMYHEWPQLDLPLSSSYSAASREPIWPWFGQHFREDPRNPASRLALPSIFCKTCLLSSSTRPAPLGLVSESRCFENSLHLQRTKCPRPRA